MRFGNRFVVFMAFVLVCSVGRAQVAVPNTLESDPLTREVRSALIELAAQCDVLVLGELHGTQEVPALAAGLLGGLSELGYGVLALEVPLDEQDQLSDWATGKTETVPDFFAKPSAHGKSGVQVLSLIRTALSPPFSWQLICFDETWEQSIAEYKRSLEQKEASFEDSIAYFVDRDQRMAAAFSNAHEQLSTEAKTLVICGGLHARTRNHATKENVFTKLWPCFAALLAQNDPNRRVRSVHVVPCSGEFFASRGDDGVGKVHTIRGGRTIEQAEVRTLEDGNWDWELELPRVTAATFLAPPTPFLPASNSD